MIVVNLTRSMRRVLDQVRVGIADDDLLDLIRSVTTTEWGGLGKQALDQYGGPEWNGLSVEDLYAHGGRNQRDFLLGIYGDQIVSIYYIVGWHRDEERKVVFDVEDAAEMAGAIGEPVPGGPWKRGEARPVRYIDTSAFMRSLDKRGLLDAYDEDPGAIDRKMVEVIRALASPPKPARSPMDGVEVEPDPRGGVRLTVPIGTKVTVVQRKE